MSMYVCFKANDYVYLVFSIQVSGSLEMLYEAHK